MAFDGQGQSRVLLQQVPWRCSWLRRHPGQAVAVEGRSKPGVARILRLKSSGETRGGCTKQRRPSIIARQPTGTSAGGVVHRHQRPDRLASRLPRTSPDKQIERRIFRFPLAMSVLGRAFPPNPRLWIVQFVRALNSAGSMSSGVQLTLRSRRNIDHIDSTRATTLDLTRPVGVFWAHARCSR